MSALTRVILDIDPDQGRRARKAELYPTGTVVGVALDGGDSHRPRLLGWGTIRLETRLPAVVAQNTLDMWRDQISARRGRYNCLAYMAKAALGVEEPGIDELMFDAGPDLVPGRYKDVKDLSELVAGTACGLPDSDSQLIHGIVIAGEPNRHLDVDGTGGVLRYAKTTDTMRDYQVRCGSPARLVALEPGGYSSSEVIKTVCTNTS